MVKKTACGALQIWGEMPPLIRVSVVFLGLILLISLGADLLAPYDYRSQDLLNRLAPPAFLGGDWAHPLGTDQLGRDLLSRLIYATRFSILVAFLGTCIGAVLGTGLGFLAARTRGLGEETIMMFVDFQASLPFMLLALAVLAFMGDSFILFILLMGVYGWEVFARLSRGMVLSAVSDEYALAVRMLGGSSWRVYAMHVLPNIFAGLMVQFTLNFPQTILLETSLSFLGLGIKPPLTSLGQMLGAGRSHILYAWWISVFPGLVIFLTTLSFSIFGDWVRDRLDPTLRGERGAVNR